jgi:hypothetical protein
VDRTAIDRLMDELDDIAARRKAARAALADIDPAPLPELVSLDAIAARPREDLGHVDP